jgi:ParB-like chromosome segregation protein Spo0J
MRAMKVISSIMKVSELKEHEEVNEKELEALKKRIMEDGVLKMPIAVDESTHIVLDGHYRLRALKDLGYSKVPVVLVDYSSPEIKVLSWRRGQKITKERVIKAGLSGNKLPYKSSKHMVLIGKRLRHISAIQREVYVPLEKLV